MLKLTLHDRNGTPLNFGDIVKISNGREFSFYAEVKYLTKEKMIAPFHTFSFHSLEKVDNLPENATQSTEERYKIWWVDQPESDMNAKDFEGYLSDWRQCEHLIEKGMYQIELPTTLF